MVDVPIMVAWKRSRTARVAVALAVYLGIAMFLTWPLGANLATGIPCVGPYVCRFDPLYVMWALSWETHAIATAPARLIDANIYHPTPAALLYGPAAFGALPFFAPTFALTGNPILALNVMFLGGIVGTALALHLVASAWTGSEIAGVVSACTFLTNGSSWTTAPASPHFAFLFYFPFIIFVAAQPLSARGAALLIVLVVLQSLVDPIYIAPAVFGPLLMLAACRLVRPSAMGAGIVLLGVLGVGGVLLLPVYAGYAAIRADNPSLLQQTLWKVGDFYYVFRPASLSAAGLRGTVAPEASWLLLGVVLVGATAALVTSNAGGSGFHGGWRHGALWTVVGLFMSTRMLSLFGHPPFELPQYSLAARIVPSVTSVVRFPVRLGVGSSIGFALLAGFAVDAWGRAMASVGRPWAAPWIRVCLALILCGALYRDFRTLPSISIWTGPEVPSVALDALRRGVGPVLELPIRLERSPLAYAADSAQAMFRSIFHWRPLLNGYSSYYPAAFPERMVLAQRLPEAAALETLARDTGLSTILVHVHELAPEDREAWSAARVGRRDLDLIASDEMHLVFAVRSQ
jgi:hypothetical protein